MEFNFTEMKTGARPFPLAIPRFSSPPRPSSFPTSYDVTAKPLSRKVIVIDLVDETLPHRLATGIIAPKRQRPETLKEQHFDKLRKWEGACKDLQDSVRLGYSQSKQSAFPEAIKSFSKAIRILTKNTQLQTAFHPADLNHDLFYCFSQLWEKEDNVDQKLNYLSKAIESLHKYLALSDHTKDKKFHRLNEFAIKILDHAHHLLSDSLFTLSYKYFKSILLLDFQVQHVIDDKLLQEIVNNILYNMSTCICGLRETQDEASESVTKDFREILRENSPLIDPKTMQFYQDWLETAFEAVVVDLTEEVVDLEKKDTAQKKTAILKPIPLSDLEEHYGNYWQSTPKRPTSNSNLKRAREENSMSDPDLARVSDGPIRKKARVTDHPSIQKSESLDKMMKSAYEHLLDKEYESALKEYQTIVARYDLTNFFNADNIGDIYYHMALCCKKLSKHGPQRLVEDAIGYCQLSLVEYRRSSTPYGSESKASTKAFLKELRK